MKCSSRFYGYFWIALILVLPAFGEASGGSQAHHFQYSETQINRALTPLTELECYLQAHPQATFASLAGQAETRHLVQGVSPHPRIREEDSSFDFMALLLGGFHWLPGQLSHSGFKHSEGRLFLLKERRYSASNNRLSQSWCLSNKIHQIVSRALKVLDY